MRYVVFLHKRTPPRRLFSPIETRSFSLIIQHSVTVKQRNDRYCTDYNVRMLNSGEVKSNFGNISSLWENVSSAGKQ